MEWEIEEREERKGMIVYTYMYVSCIFTFCRSGSGSLPSPATPEAQAAWSDDQWRDGTISKDYNHG